jgi:hypothetical protein
MPVIVIAAAAWAGTAVVAAGGIAAFAAAEGMMAAISAVGAITSAVGVVTGNKELTAIGGIASLAGGIGALTSSSGALASESGALADTVAASNADTLGATGALSASPTDAAVAASSGGDIQTALNTQAVGVVDPSAAVAADATGTVNTGGAVVPTGTDASQSATQANIAAPSAETINPSSTPVDSSAALPPGTLQPGGAPAPGIINNQPAFEANFQGSDVLTNPNPGVNAGAVNGGGGIMDTISKFGTFAKNNKDLLSLGGNFIGGAFDKNKAAQGRLYDAQARGQDAQIGLYNARTASEVLQADIARQQALNANSVPNITNLQVANKSIYPASAAPIYRAPQIGLINSNRG